MKIALISRGRTNSSVIQESLANKYNLKNLKEEYFTASSLFRKKRKVFYFSKNKKLDIDMFEDSIKFVTKDFFSNDRFICKIWPSMLWPSYNFINYIESLREIKNFLVFNISECLNLKEYDKIYFLDRDLKSSLFSWVYARHTKIFHTYKNIKIQELNPVINLTKFDLVQAKAYVLEYFLQQKIKDFLITNNISFIEINETTGIEELVDQNVVSTLINNKNYKSLINDYYIIENIATDYLIRYQQEINDWYY